ncbi:anhydro-N-acetylmuramic acid kinase [Candidatus Bathyarchaeota archaeon]|nr:anhydro-N-acetylmuramic acid kinase [Candidatus Bathyarchaeota archaeon]
MMMVLRERASRKIIGLMSGTSVDGVTLALTDIKGSGEKARIELLHHKTFGYIEEIREKIFKSFSLAQSNSKLICELNFLLGEYFAKCIENFLEERDISYKDVDLIGSHGQTIWHEPEAESLLGFSQKSTLQIGEPTVISMKTGIPVVADFRKADITAGGQGAPLTPYLDYVLHRDKRANRVLQNIGGIANLTYLPAEASREDVIAFDTGPGNMIIDAAIELITNGAKKFDRGGEIAGLGKINEQLLRKLLDHPYYSKFPPKTTGREDFGAQYTSNILKKAGEMNINHLDFISTVTELTARTICNAYDQFLGPIDEVYLSGGGSKNPNLVSRIREILDGVKVMDYNVLDIPSEAKEAVLMALLANEYIMDTPSNLPAATGAKKEVKLGVYYSPPTKQHF